MRRLVLYTAVSIDGYIAAEGDNLDWLMAFESTEDVGEVYNKLNDRVDTALMGNSTYRFVVNAGVPDPYPDKETIVFTRTETEDTDRINYVSDDIVTYVEALKVKEGKDIWLVGGGVINSIFLKADLIDELQLTIVPVTLGSGTRMFQGGGSFREFKVKEVLTLDNGMVHMTYVRK